MDSFLGLLRRHRQRPRALAVPSSNSLLRSAAKASFIRTSRWSNTGFSYLPSTLLSREEGLSPTFLRPTRPSLAVDKCFTHQMGTLDFALEYSSSRVRGQMDSYRRGYSRPLTDPFRLPINALSDDALADMVSLYEVIVKPLTARCVTWATSNIAKAAGIPINTETVESIVLSTVERHRITPAMHRFEFACHLFGAPAQRLPHPAPWQSSGEFAAVDSLDRFFLLFGPW